MSEATDYIEHKKRQMSRLNDLQEEINKLAKKEKKQQESLALSYKLLDSISPQLDANLLEVENPPEVNMRSQLLMESKRPLEQRPPCRPKEELLQEYYDLTTRYYCQNGEVSACYEAAGAIENSLRYFQEKEKEDFKALFREKMEIAESLGVPGEVIGGINMEELFYCNVVVE